MKKVFIIRGVVILLVLAVVFVYFSNKKDKAVDYNLDNYINDTIVNNVASSTEGEALLNNNTQINTNMDNNEQKGMTMAVLHTNIGDISFEFSKDKPATTQNFIKLASSGFYDGIKFHRVIEGFMIQAGDPLSKDDSQKAYWGTGGPGYKFADELTGSEQYNIGTVAMANSGPNTNGSQFFIMTSNTPLPPSYTVFGKVTAGQDVAMKIQSVATDGEDKPLTPVIINSVDILSN